MSIMRWCLWMLVAGAVAAGAVLNGQYVSNREPQRNIQKDAQRCVTFLELPDRRRAATHQLMRYGKAAVAALSRGLRHPDPEIVCQCVHMLKMIGPDAAAARPELLKLAASNDLVLSHAGRWGLAGIHDHGIVQANQLDGKTVHEFDSKGKSLRTILVKERAYDTDRLPNGNYLACFLNKGLVVELDPKSKIVWSFDGCTHPLDADRLPNGNTLIAGGKSKRVLEVDPRGKVVWQWKGANWPNDADRLPCGNTLVADSPARMIYEVDPSGKVVWSHKSTNGGVIDVERLPTGNTLFVRSHGKGAVEIDLKGMIVREFTDGYPRAIARHPDGTTVVGGNAGLVFYDSRGKVLWKKTDLGQINAVHRY